MSNYAFINKLQVKEQLLYHSSTLHSNSRVFRTTCICTVESRYLKVDRTHCCKIFELSEIQL